MGKIKFVKKAKATKEKVVETADTEIQLPAVTYSSDAKITKEKWINRQRVLVLAARGINHRDRHLMRDIRTLMPHHRPESKMERAKTLSVINEMGEMKHCNKAILFEGRRKKDLYMWLSNIPDGPSVKFLIHNVHTMGELKLTGNCLRGSRPLLSFDNSFSEIPHLKLLKELYVQIFGVPNQHPKSQPFFDHVYTFTYVDNKIWFRNYQILSEDGGLTEIGPRFVMDPIKIFDGSFGGETLWENPDYVSPAKYRQSLKKVTSDKYVNRIEQKVHHIANKPKVSYDFNELGEVLEGRDPLRQAEKILNKKSAKKELVKEGRVKKPTKLTAKKLDIIKGIIKKSKASIRK